MRLFLGRTHEIPKRKGVKFAIIADDLTGACDTGVQFKKKGLKAIVVNSIEDIKKIVYKAEVVVLNTDSRGDSPSLAYQKVKSATEVLKKSGIKFFYKKIDSTLRGNIGWELEAMMDELESKVAIVAPAFPANGRITVGGFQLVNNVPLAETVFAKDDANFFKESYVPILLQKQVRRKVGHIDLTKVAMGTESLRSEIDYQRKSGNEIIVIDASTQDHLRKIAEVAVDFHAINLTCGSAGLAEEIAQVLTHSASDPAVVVSGSLSEVTRRQLLRAEKELNAHVIDIDPSKILEKGETKEKEVRRVLDEAVRAIIAKRDVIIATGILEESKIRAKRKAEELGIENGEVGKILVAVLGEIAEKIVNFGKISGLVLTGGDTAMGVCATMRATGLAIKNEVLPGIPSSTLVGGKHNGLKIVTKAGGFGDENAIVSSIKHLRWSS